MSGHSGDDSGRLPEDIVVRYPEVEEIRPTCDKAAAFLGHCRAVKPVGDYADRADFDVMRLRPWLGYIMILDHLPDQDDFRYRMYGSGISAESGFDMTGRLVSDFKSRTGDFFLLLYRQAVAERVLIYSAHARVHAQYSCDWHRVMCPVRQDEGIQIVACNFPVRLS